MEASHKEALESIERIEKLVTNELETNVFQRDALDISDLSFIPDIIMTDVPD